MKITVIGLGYVGTVAASCLADLGHDVTGVDLDPNRVSTLQSGQMPIYEPGLEEITKTALGRELVRFTHTSDFHERLGEAVLVAVGTPQGPEGAADLSQVRSAVRWGPVSAGPVEPRW